MIISCTSINNWPYSEGVNFTSHMTELVTSLATMRGGGWAVGFILKLLSDFSMA